MEQKVEGSQREPAEAQGGSASPGADCVRSPGSGLRSTDVLVELRGTIALEGIEVTDVWLNRFAEEFEDASRRGVIQKLLQEARARFPSKTTPGKDTDHVVPEGSAMAR